MIKDILKFTLFFIIYVTISIIITCNQKTFGLGLVMLVLTVPIINIGFFIIVIKSRNEWSRIQKENHDNLEKIARNMENTDE